MTPIKFPEANRNLGAPVDWNTNRHGVCGTLPTYHDGDQYISCWRLSWRERFAILFGAPVWLLVVSIGHPPVALHGKRTVFTHAQAKLAADSARRQGV